MPASVAKVGGDEVSRGTTPKFWERSAEMLTRPAGDEKVPAGIAKLTAGEENVKGDAATTRTSKPTRVLTVKLGPAWHHWSGEMVTSFQRQAASGEPPIGTDHQPARLPLMRGVARGARSEAFWTGEEDALSR